MMACIQAKNFIRISAINTCIRVKFFKRGTIFTNSQQNIKAISAQTRTPISFNAIHSRKRKFKLSICKRTYQKGPEISAFSCYSSICKYARLEYTFFQVASVNPAPEVSEEEGSYASRFCCWFLESSKNCLLLLVAPPSLIDTLAQLLA